MAKLHAACFVYPRPWSAAELAATLQNPLCFQASVAQGFLIGRVVADEAELLTLAVDPGARRQGIGGALVAEFLATARRLGAARAFLEVAEDNRPALTLYHRAGFANAGLRRAYYHRDDGPALDALVLQKDFA